jgi:hypothetical protein
MKNDLERKRLNAIEGRLKSDGGGNEFAKNGVELFFFFPSSTSRIIEFML